MSEKATLPGAGRQDKRGLVLAEAIELFNDHGYHDTRLEDVAERLKTTKTSISYHFKSKEVLLFEAYSATCDFADAAAQSGQQSETGLAGILTVIETFAEAHSAAITGRRAPLAVINDHRALRPEDQMAIATRMQAYSRSIHMLLDRGRADGSVRIKSTGAATFFLLSVHQWLRHWLQAVPPRHHDRAVEDLLSLLSQGLCADRHKELHEDPPYIAMATENFIFDRDARHKMKLDAFLRVGTRHLNLHGFRSLSVNEIASELGVSRGVFYYHFDDKEALLKSCANRSLDIMERAINQHRDLADMRAIDKLHGALTSLFEGHLNDLNPLLRQSLYGALSPRDRPVLLARLRKVTAGFGELIAEAISDGSARPVEVEGLDSLVCGLIFGATRQRLGAFGLTDEKNGVQDRGFGASAYFEPLFRGLGSQ